MVNGSEGRSLLRIPAQERSMIPPNRQQLALVTLVCAAAGLYGWAVFLSTFSHDGSIGPRYNAPGTDWMVFYAAARAFFDGNLPLIFDGHRFTAHQNQMFAAWLSGQLPFHPWLYPPHFLLLALPFGLIPFSASYALFMCITGAVLVATLWLMVPVALIAARQWRVLASAAAVASVLALASLAVFGVEMWRQWLEMALSPPADFYSNWLESGRSWGLSVYTCAWVLGASHGVATLVQAAATLGAAAGVYVAFRGALAPDRQLAVLLAAAILAGPHVSSYDTLLLAIAASLLFCRALEEGAPLYEITLMLSVWLLPLFNPPRATPLGLMTPLLVALFIAIAMAGARMRSPASAAAAA